MTEREKIFNGLLKEFENIGQEALLYQIDKLIELKALETNVTPSTPPYRELYGKIVYDSNSLKPKLEIDYNTLGFIPIYNQDHYFGGNLITASSNYIILNDIENTDTLETNVHPSITNFRKVHFYVQHRLYAEQSNGGVVKTDFGISLEETLLYLDVTDLNGNNLVNSGGLCSADGDDFFHTHIHILIFD